MTRFSKKPFLCLVIAEPTIQSSICYIDKFERKVDVFEINVAQFSEVSKAKEIFGSTKKPCIATCRRSYFMRFYGYTNLPFLKDEERARRLLSCVDYGVSAIDFELDIFDKKYEFKGNTLIEKTKDKQAIQAQMKLVEDVKSKGSEVLISSHIFKRVNEKLCVDVFQEIVNRGADLAKIVCKTYTQDDLIAFLNTTNRLRRESTIPFTMMNLGSFTPLARLLALVFGSSWVYCRTDSKHSFVGQPTVNQARSFLKLFKSSKRLLTPNSS
jgi:3-dehydroquinate dehydratase type I